VDRILREQRRLEAEEEVAEGDLVYIQRELNERLARLARLRRQKRLLLDKGKEMVRRNLESLDELEAEESLEVVAPTNNALDEVECQDLEAVVPASCAFDEVEVDWSAVDLSSLGPVDLGVLDETVEPVVDSSSNS